MELFVRQRGNPDHSRMLHYARLAHMHIYPNQSAADPKRRGKSAHAKGLPPQPGVGTSLGPVR